ncbi:MAG: hypothetical protein AAGC60_15680 [Acidobacteriota bacterium]
MTNQRQKTLGKKNCTFLLTIWLVPLSLVLPSLALAEDPTPLGDWREIQEGVDGYPAGPMLEIALRRTHSDKLEMFKWRSEFISMLSVQPGSQVEREWHSISGIPANGGAGTWTGMTWWENQQRWQDMANMLFPSPVTASWLQTIHMTLVFVKPLDDDFDLRTLAQSGEEILELGLIAFPTTGAAGSSDRAADLYLDALERAGVDTYRFEIYSNPYGFPGPFMVAYNQNGPPKPDGERWFVYMASYQARKERDAVHAREDVKEVFNELQVAMVNEHSDIQVMERSTSKVCCQAAGRCLLDPDECSVGILGAGDSWASNCNECPRPCITGYNVCSRLSSRTCLDVGGKLVDVCP